MSTVLCDGPATAVTLVVTLLRLRGTLVRCTFATTARQVGT